jgi:HAE1 family hydrophobic/amphiphilic exporter-1
VWISDFSIQKPVVTIVSMLALVVFGLFALYFLKTDEFPDVNPPIVAVSALYPGAGPSSVEREIVEPLEDAFAGISGVEKITAKAMDNYSILIVEFSFEKDLQEATQDLRDKISEVRTDLPQEMEEPLLVRFDPQNFPIVSLTLSSDRYGQEELTRLADPGITGELQSLAGVAQVKIVGAIAPELTVALRPDALEANGVSVGQVVQALQLSNLAAPVGAITSSRKESTIRLQGRLTSPQEFEAIAITSTGGRLIRLGDVADVRAGTEEARSAALYEGKGRRRHRDHQGHRRLHDGRRGAGAGPRRVPRGHVARGRRAHRGAGRWRARGAQRVGRREDARRRRAAHGVRGVSCSWARGGRP